MGYKDATARALAPTAPLRQQGSDELSHINEQWLLPRGLKPLGSLGVHSDGWRILGVHASHDHERSSVVELLVRHPDEDNEDRSVIHPVRFMPHRASGGRGCILVVMVNDHIATVRQFRLPVMIACGIKAAFTTELPRAFASGENVATLLDKKIRRAAAGKTQITDEALLAEARTLLGSELGQLVTQSEIAVEEIVSLGSISEWQDSMDLIEVVLVRFSHPDLEALKRLDLGPADMKIRLYPFAQLLRRAERERINMADQASLAGLVLGWAYVKSQGLPLATPANWTRYSWNDPTGRELLGDPAWRRILDTTNRQLKELGYRPLDSLGTSAPGAQILSLEKDPWLKRRRWSVLVFQHRNPRRSSAYFIRVLTQNASYGEEALIPIVEGRLLTVRAHHLPFLTGSDPRRAWCNRSPTLEARTDQLPNVTSRLFGEQEACLSYASPGDAVVRDFFRRADKVEARLLGPLYEDSGSNAVVREMRLAQMSCSNVGALLDEINSSAGRKAKLAALPIHEALLDPEAHGIRDQQTLATLLVAGEVIGVLS